MRVSEHCHYVLITTGPDETLVDAAGRMNWPKAPTPGPPRWPTT